MVYVALLRGVNVGGKHMVSMADLKQSFESLRFERVQTYINSGNILFWTSEPQRRLATIIEQRLNEDFGLEISVVLRSLHQMEALVAQIPDNWINDAEHKSDVMFLRPEVDAPDVIDKISWDNAHETLRFLPGALVWFTTKAYAPKSKVLHINRLPLYKQVTVRNPNTVRKLLTLMRAL